MTEAEVIGNLVACHLLLKAIADEPEVFMDVIGQSDYSLMFVSNYFAGLLDIAGTDMP